MIRHGTRTVHPIPSRPTWGHGSWPTPTGVYDAAGHRHEFRRSVRVARFDLRKIYGEVRSELRRRKDRWKKRVCGYRLGLVQHPPKPFVVPPRYAKSELPRVPPSISIVTPSYNHAEFLERTMKSVLDQDYPSLEYIVQDGGSKDGTIELLSRYAHRLAHWESAKDNGQSHALNLGFQHATGEIMAYLNSDDLLLPGALNYIATFFGRHPETDVVYGHRTIIDEHDQEIGRWILPPHVQDVPVTEDVLSWADYVPQETLFWRRRIWERSGMSFDESFQFAMDWDLILRFREAGAKFARLPRFLGAFRIHTRQKSLARMADLGAQEMGRLRERCLGRQVSDGEIHQQILPYLRRHVVYYNLYRLGIFRY